MKTGVYHHIKMSDYLEIKAFSSSLGQTILTKSPLHAWTASPWNQNKDREDSQIADIGTYAHAMLLEGCHESLVICPFSDWRTKEAQTMRDDARAEGNLPILEHKISEIKEMVKIAHEFIAESEIAGIFNTGGAEKTIIWQEVDILCKVRPDWLSSNICLSYKTTSGSSNPSAWIRTQLPNYDIGTVLYERGVRTVCDTENIRVVHLVQEQTPPFSCSLVALSPAWQDLAERKLDRALKTWSDCLTKNRFPSYPLQICHAEPPAYAVIQFEEQEMGNPYDPAILFGGKS